MRPINYINSLVGTKYPQQDHYRTIVQRLKLAGRGIAGLMLDSTHYRSSQEWFYGSDNPINSVAALKDNGYWLVNQVKGQSHRAQLTKR